MTTDQVVRAWKDENYREALTKEQQAQLPGHPAGSIEFEQPALEDETLFVGGKITHGCHSINCLTKERSGC
ncbi:MAG TPA: mersacidin/lichenicidin family type 2 lantibiotic [Candidatus Acidoferrum sp.]|jgi:mersacidin/lichenicidin family type 2 lantibiotic|nr:mersacidin/lichenicidin family type 2 lantibiotic [Candidatus Acidoferrum sp.]